MSTGILPPLVNNHPTQPHKKRPLRVLVVEDYADALNTLTALLRLVGHDVHAAPDGPSALRTAQEFPPDVVLLDLGLPGMDGYAVAEHLHKKTTTYRPLLVAVTGFADDGSRRRSVEVGIDLYLVKPVDPTQLLEVLARFEAFLIGTTVPMDSVERRVGPRQPVRGQSYGLRQLSDQTRMEQKFRGARQMRTAAETLVEDAKELMFRAELLLGRARLFLETSQVIRGGASSRSA